MSLTTEKVKWMLPPGVRGSADSSDESEVDSDFDSSEEEEEERPRRRSSRRRGRGRAGPGSRRIGRRPQRSPSYEPSVRSCSPFPESPPQDAGAMYNKALLWSPVSPAHTPSGHQSATSCASRAILRTAMCCLLQERRMRLDGPHCHQPTRFGPGYTPPTSPTFARKATAHGSLVCSLPLSFNCWLARDVSKLDLRYAQFVACVEFTPLPLEVFMEYGGDMWRLF